MKLRKIQKKINAKLIIGFFDGPHKGHLLLFKNNYDASILTFDAIPKKSAPIFSLKERKEQLKKLGFSKIYTYNIFKENITSINFINKYLLNKNISEIIVGSNFTIGKEQMTAKELKQKINIPVRIINNNNSYSTTKIKGILSESNITEVNKMLLGNYYIKSKVIVGNQMARMIGYPTINFINQDYIGNGIYKTETIYKNKKYKSLTFIGKSETFNFDGPRTIETHIIGFDKQIYNKIVKVIFIEKIGNIKKYNSIEKLKKDINSYITNY